MFFSGKGDFLKLDIDKKASPAAKFFLTDYVAGREVA